MNLRSLTIALSLSLAAPCSARAGAQEPGALNVVLVLLETLRPDHLGCYGYARATSPSLDRLAAESAVFENAFAQSSQSLISAASVFTGLYPPSHGVVNVNSRLAADAGTLAGELKKHGYMTAAFTGGFFLNKSFGLNAGFGVYDDSKDFGALADTLPAALKWLGENAGRRFFLTVHGYDAHAPYRAPAEFQDRFGEKYEGPLAGLTLDYYLADRIRGDGLYEDFRLKKKVAALGRKDFAHIISKYDGAVLYADSKLGELLAELDRLGLKDSTAVIFAGTAGEALMDRGEIISSFHGGLYDEGIRVPLIVRVPGLPPARVKAEAQLVDVLPTVLDLLRLSVPAAAQGQSLKPLVVPGAKPARERLVYAQTLSPETGEPVMGARKYPWKLMLSDGKKQLYNLASDPREKKDLSAEKPDVLKALNAELDAFIRAMPRRKAGNYQKPLAIVSERMKKMGYWWMERPRVEYWDGLRRKKAGAGTVAPGPAKDGEDGGYQGQ